MSLKSNSSEDTQITFSSLTCFNSMYEEVHIIYIKNNGNETRLKQLLKKIENEKKRLYNPKIETRVLKIQKIPETLVNEMIKYTLTGSLNTVNIDTLPSINSDESFNTYFWKYMYK
jgi:hypothetical protein